MKPFWLVVGAALAFLVSDSSGENINMSGLRKRRSKRLFYMRNDRVVPRAQVEKAKKQAKAGGACLHAVWAYNADEARDLIAEGRAQSVCKLSKLSEIFDKYVYRFERKEKEDLPVKFYSRDLDYVEEYADILKNKGIEGKIIRKRINLKYPFIVNLTRSQFSDPKIEKGIINNAIHEGNDGVIFRQLDDDLEFIAKLDLTKMRPYIQLDH